jgi:hypothetical protein
MCHRHGPLAPRGRHLKKFLGNPPLIMGMAWLVLCLAVVLAGMALRLSPLEMSLLVPPVSGPLLTPLVGLFAAVAVLLLWLAAGHARQPAARGPFSQLILFFPLALAFIWLVSRPGVPGKTEWVFLGIFLVAAAWLLRISPPAAPPAGPAPRHWPWDLAFILFPALAGLALGSRPDLSAAGLSLLTYPLYALTQLAVFLILPARRLPRLGLSSRLTALFCSLVFALLHAPNLVVMVVSGAAMFVWCRQYLSGRPVWRLALVMGLAATLFSQFLDDDLTGHMRVGPGHTRALVMDHLAEVSAPGSRQMLVPFLQEVYPLLLERSPTRAELEAWESTLTEARLTGLAWQFFNSREYRRKADEKGWPLPPSQENHWTSYEPEWRDRIAAFGHPAYRNKCGRAWTDFLKCLYRDILQRPGSQAELSGWSQELTSNERRTLARVILHNRLEWRRRPFTGMRVQEMRLRR